MNLALSAVRLAKKLLLHQARHHKEGQAYRSQDLDAPEVQLHDFTITESWALNALRCSQVHESDAHSRIRRAKYLPNSNHYDNLAFGVYAVIVDLDRYFTNAAVRA